MKFNLHYFGQFGEWLWGTVKNLYSMLEFDFGDFWFNGWTLLIGEAVFLIVLIFVGRLAK